MYSYLLALLATFALTHALDLEVDNVDLTLSSPLVGNAASDLYSRLLNQYWAKSALSGHNLDHYDQIVSITGRHPAVRAFDMQNYSPHNPWHNWQPYDDGSVQ